MTEPLDADVIWICKVCGQMVSDSYKGPADRKAILELFNRRHREMSPDCPYVLTKIEDYPL